MNTITINSLDDDLVSRFASCLTAHDLAMIAMTSKRFGAKQFQIDGINLSLMEKVAHQFVESASDGEKAALKRRRVSWEVNLEKNPIRAYFELTQLRSIARDALLAAPSIFAKPGDEFGCYGEGMMWGDHDPTYLEW